MPLDQFRQSERTEAFSLAADVLSERIGCPKRVIAAATLVDCMLSRCWSLEEYRSRDDQIALVRESVSAGEFYREMVRRW